MWPAPDLRLRAGLTERAERGPSGGRGRRLRGQRRQPPVQQRRVHPQQPRGCGIKKSKKNFSLPKETVFNKIMSGNSDYLKQSISC